MHTAGFDQSSRMVQDALIEQAGEEHVEGCIALCLEVGAGGQAGGWRPRMGSGCRQHRLACQLLCGSAVDEVCTSSRSSLAVTLCAIRLVPAPPSSTCSPQESHAPAQSPPAGRPGQHRPQRVCRCQELPHLLPCGPSALGAQLVSSCEELAAMGAAHGAPAT